MNFKEQSQSNSEGGNFVNLAKEAQVVKVYRFDVFKGVRDSKGKVTKVKSVGSSYLRDGLMTYTLHLKTFLKDTFYLLPNNKKTVSQADFVVLTREPAQASGKKYFWNHVGEGEILDGENHGILSIRWDILSEELFMTLHPVNISEFKDQRQEVAPSA